MKKSKNENKILLIIAICLVLLIIILTIIFQVLLPNSKDDTNNYNDNFVANNDISDESIYKPSQNEWITLQLSRRRK